MASKNIFTRQKMGLDYNVWIMMLVCIVLSGGLLGYSLIRHEETTECRTVNIYVNGRTVTENVYFKVDDPLTFRLAALPGDKIVWDFGDGTTKEEDAAVHVYNKAGRFYVRAKVNGRCYYDKGINVEKKSLALLDSSGQIYEVITGKGEAVVGEKLSFSTSFPAGQYEWSVENNRNFPIQTGKEANFTFRSEASYIITLMLDHDPKRKFSKTIIVTNGPSSKGGEIDPRPLIIPVPKEVVKSDSVAVADTVKAAPVVVKKKYKYVSDEILKTYLQSMVCNEMKAEEFDDYLCQGVNTRVIINEKAGKNFLSFYSEIHGKRIKIESATATRDGDNCITSLHVTYDKRGFLGRNPCKN